jgi:uncharacterized membrane protein YedE/YeeE
MFEILKQPWAWYVAGPLIALNLFLLLYFEKKFGISSSLKATCSILGAGKISNFFNYDWKQDSWLMLYVLGSIIGGFIAFQFLDAGAPVIVSAKTATALNELNIVANQSFLPNEIFGLENMFKIKNLAILIIGGMLIGFGTRWANGCTSGHAIAGLSDLQLPSLVAVIGFFIGGLIMTFLIIPKMF